MMELFSASELDTLLSSEVPNESYLLVHNLAAGLIQDVTGPLEAGTATVALPIGPDGIVDIPVGNLTAVTDVQVAGSPVSWTWERPFPRVRIDSRPCSPYASADVSIAYGSSTVPPTVKAVALSVAARAVTNPNGLRVEQIDDYSYTRAGSDDDLAGITLTQAERDALGSLAPSAYITDGR